MFSGWARSWSGGLSALDVKSGEFTRYSFHSEQPGGQSVAGVTAIYEDRDGVLWLGTLDSGLLKLDRERKQVIQVRQIRRAIRTACTIRRQNNI